MIELSKRFRFDMAHALVGYDGKCKNLHGHTYELIVTIGGVPISDPQSPKYGMIMDFTDLKMLVEKEIINVFDHSLALPSSASPELRTALANEDFRLNILPYQPTTENLLNDFAARIAASLPQNVSLRSLRLAETPNSFATWYLED